MSPGPNDHSVTLARDTVQQNSDGQEFLSVNIYKNFSDIYDAFGSEDFCMTMTEHISRILDEFGLPRNTEILDVACGTGVITVELAKLGYQMTGLDLSEYMLEHARKRAADHNVSLKLIHQDMRSIQVEQPFAAIISTHDSIDHLFLDEDLDAAFSSFSQALLPGGLFLFDMNCWEGISLLHNRTLFVEKEEQSAAYHLIAQDHTLETNIVGFIAQENNLYKRFDEQLFQRCYSDEEIMQRLEQNGLELLHKEVVQDIDGQRFKQLWTTQKTAIEIPQGY